MSLISCRSGVSRIRTFSQTSRRSKDAEAVAGTAPAHRAYMFLNSALPPSDFPARHTTPLQRALQLKFVRKGGLVNLSWDGSASSDERTSLTAFSANGRLELPEVSLDNLESLEPVINNHLENISPSSLNPCRPGIVDVYVCTHGQRDCRCGEHGGALLRALKVLYSQQADVLSESSNVLRFHEVAHVGGHHLAANALVYPQGEWLGLLNEVSAPLLLDALRVSSARPLTSEDEPLLPDYWRGRRGFSKAEQMELFTAHLPNHPLRYHSPPTDS